MICLLCFFSVSSYVLAANDTCNNYIYYNNNYKTEPVIIQYDTTINEIALLKSKLPIQHDQSLLDFKSLEKLDINKLDKALSLFAKKKFIDLNTCTELISDGFFLASGYRDQHNRLNVLLKYISIYKFASIIILVDSPNIDSSYFDSPNIDFHNISWNSDWDLIDSSGYAPCAHKPIYFLIPDIENNCKDSTVKILIADKSLPKIIPCHVDSSCNSIASLNAKFNNKIVGFFEIFKTYCSNSIRNYYMNASDLKVLENYIYTFDKKNYQKLCKKKKLWCKSYIDDYGRISVIIGDFVNRDVYKGRKPYRELPIWRQRNIRKRELRVHNKQLVFGYEDIYQKMPRCY